VNAMETVLCSHLLGIAESGGITTYAGLAALVGLDVDGPENRRRLADILRAVNTHEVSQGRPMLSAVVVLKGRKLPGRGFFDLARELGRYHGGDREAFWREELQRVHDCWRDTPSNDTTGSG